MLPTKKINKNYDGMPVNIAGIQSKNSNIVDTMNLIDISTDIFIEIILEDLIVMGAGIQDMDITIMTTGIAIYTIPISGTIIIIIIPTLIGDGTEETTGASGSIITITMIPIIARMVLASL